MAITMLMAIGMLVVVPQISHQYLSVLYPLLILLVTVVKYFLKPR